MTATVDVSEARLRNLYLPAFKAALEAGAATVMASFNTIGGIPAPGNAHTLTGLLKEQWVFRRLRRRRLQQRGDCRGVSTASWALLVIMNALKAARLRALTASGLAPHPVCLLSPL